MMDHEKSVLPASVIEDLRRRHSGPERGYHGWDHPQALLALLATVASALHDPLAVECAILFHDAIYDPANSDNEHRSAVLAQDALAGLVPDASRARAVRLIEATARHEIPDGLPPEDADDCRIFLDMDLSVLGADEATFDRYEAGVRHEYRHVAAPDFRRGRAAILERFLARDRLYLSDWGRARFEDEARGNLARSLRALRV